MSLARFLLTRLGRHDVSEQVVGSDEGMRALHLVGDRLADVMEQRSIGDGRSPGFGLRRLVFGAGSDGQQMGLPQLQAVWTPPVTRMAMQLQEQRESSAPLWSTLPKADLKPVVSAVEADLHTHLESQRAQRERPAMPVLAGQSGDESGGASRGGTSSAAQRAALDASTRLLDAVRAQAASQAIASDNRISLGDLTLIAFADSNKQMAAAAAHAEHTPDTHPLKKAIDNSANKKFMEDRKGFETKLKKVAELALDSLEKSKRIAKERFGSHG